MKLLITPSILPHRNELNFGECGPFLNWVVAETPQKRTFPKEWSAPLDREGKVRVIRELDQRAAQKNRKLKVAVVEQTSFLSEKDTTRTFSYL